jgi:HD superfamily phosphodiesterase
MGLSIRESRRPDGVVRELVRVPDTPAAREAEDLAARVYSRALLNHALRTYVWGSLIGGSTGRAFDAEVLYVAALLHDVGLMPGYDTGRCFETDGAHAARALLASVGWSAERTELAANAIRDHWSGPEDHDDVEAVLLAQGAAVDAIGNRGSAVDDATRERVVAALPREGFKDEFVTLLESQAARKPRCRVHQALQAGFAALVME